MAPYFLKSGVQLGACIVPSNVCAYAAWVSDANNETRFSSHVSTSSGFTSWTINKSLLKDFCRRYISNLLASDAVTQVLLRRRPSHTRIGHHRCSKATGLVRGIKIFLRQADITATLIIKIQISALLCAQFKAAADNATRPSSAIGNSSGRAGLPSDE